jgi:hypothetical protein
LGYLGFEFLSLFRLPARSRFGEGRDFDIRLPAAGRVFGFEEKMVDRARRS